MNLGWGNIAGSDVKLFNKGIGRYVRLNYIGEKNFYYMKLIN